MSNVNHPKHYGKIPGIECIDVIRHFIGNRANAIKYIWRAGEKGDELEDLLKAKWYIEDEIARVKFERNLIDGYGAEHDPESSISLKQLLLLTTEQLKKQNK